MIIIGDCLEKLKDLPENSVDAVVTDPPYGLSFMGKKWDYDVPSQEIWEECLRVLKPGGYLLAFAGTRTQHRMAVRIEDAGFEIRDMIFWTYASGFPKSLNIFKQLKKNCTCGNMEEYEKKAISGKQNTEHDLRPMSESNLSQTKSFEEKQGEVLQSGLSEQSVSLSGQTTSDDWREKSSLERRDNLQKTERELQRSDVSEMPEGVSADGEERRIHNATQISNGSISEQTTDKNRSSASHRPQSSEQQDREPCAFCKQYFTQAVGAFGYGSALKPACEPISVCRKPISEKNLADNYLKWGVGGINIDGSRIPANWKEERPESWFNSGTSKSGEATYGGNLKTLTKTTVGDRLNNAGRFPANLIHDGSDEVVSLFPNTKSGKLKSDCYKNDRENDSMFAGGGNFEHRGYKADSGSASRFFYCAKSSRSERNRGLDSTLTVKYNGSICKEENMVAVQLLQKVIFGQELVSFSTGESGENIMAQCQSDSLSTILTETKRIIGLKIYNSLMLSLTRESTQGANSEMEVGGNLAESVADLKRWLLTTTKGNQELALGASRVVLEVLSLISEEENWKKLGNFHSTVKPIALMEYLVKLVSKEGAVVLDPFMGSGSTGIACRNLNRQFIGIEREPEYAKIAEARINASKKTAKTLF